MPFFLWTFQARMPIASRHSAKTVRSPSPLDCEKTIGLRVPEGANRASSGYFSEVFRGRPRGRKVDKISGTDASWACHSGDPTASEERHALANVHSLTTNPYCS